MGRDCFRNHCGVGGEDFGGAGGIAVVPASHHAPVSHELGHAFGLRHDYRNNYGSFDEDPMLTSSCSFELLDVSRYFNTERVLTNKPATIQMLPPQPSPPYVIRLRFEINDPDGTHQAQLVTDSVIDCKSLNGESSTVVEFITTELPTSETMGVFLYITDVHGHSTSKWFSIDVTILPSEVISIPDANLASVIRSRLRLAPDEPITNIDMLTLQPSIWIGGYQIKDLTGLEHAVNLKGLGLINNQISDVTPLAKLTKLQSLNLNVNQISDVTPLAKLTNLRWLELYDNNISDVLPLIGLTKLQDLRLGRNPIKNREPLLTMLRQNPDIKIYLKEGGEPLPVTLSHFRALHTDTGVVLNWTTESEVDNAGFYIYRSGTKDGEFKVVNTTMIQGAGTTGERSTYTWTDTTAKPNTIYYYQIEDVSHAGVRKRLATVRLRGLVSASGKLMTRWANLK